MPRLHTILPKRIAPPIGRKDVIARRGPVAASLGDRVADADDTQLRGVGGGIAKSKKQQQRKMGEDF